jgi:hypothetical protein
VTCFVDGHKGRKQDERFFSNKMLDILEFLEHLRFVFDELDPCKLTIVINETNIILKSINIITSRTHTSENMRSNGAFEVLVEMGYGNYDI